MGVNGNSTLLTKTRDLINAAAAGKMRLIPSNSVLFTKSGASTLLNQRAILGKDSYVVSHIAAALPFKGVESKWLFYFLQLVDFATIAHATNMPSLPLSRAKAIRVPIAPTNEQTQIIASVEELLSALDKGIESLKTAREQLTVYRQAVLRHAFEGKLTEEWRKKHADELEPAKTLLEKIKAEREQRYRQQLKDWNRAVKTWESSGKEGKKPTKPDEPKEFPPLTEEELARLPELPEGWRWVKLSNVTDVSGGITKNAKREKLEMQVPYLRVANVYANDLRLDDIHKIGVEPNELKRTLLEHNDLLIVEGNGSKEQIGRAALWNEKIKGCVHQNHLIKARPFSQLNPNFALHFFLSNAGRDLITEVASSTSGLYTLNISKVEGIKIPFLTIREQDKIVEGIESRLSVAEKLEQNIEDGLKQAEALRQSLLRKAFEGRLVPQDPNDEPASILLERIKREKAKLKKKARKEKTVAV